MPSRRKQIVGATVGLVIVAAALGLLVGYPLYRFATIKSRFVRHADDVSELVEAIYRFHETTGLWPERLGDVSTAVPEGWTYAWPGYDASYGPELRLQGPLHMKLLYRFPAGVDNRNWGWKFRLEGDESTLDINVSPPSDEPLSEDELLQRRRTEIDRRIERDPENPLHHEALQQLEANRR